MVCYQVHRSAEYLGYRKERLNSFEKTKDSLKKRLQKLKVKA